MLLESSADVALAAVLATWLLVSAVCQRPSRLERVLRRADVCSLIPRWHFFAPRPSMQDFHLVYRDRSSAGDLSPWREVPASAPPRVVYPVWNPGRRHNKALFDVTQALTRLTAGVTDERQRELQITVPYIVLLTYVSSLRRLEDPEATQFALVMSHGRRAIAEPSVFFVSGLHALR